MKKYVSPLIHTYGNLSTLVQVLNKGPRDVLQHGNIL
jgi:hypothetical protein